MFARRLVIFVEFGNIDEAKPRLFEAYPQSVEFLRVVINEEVTPKQVTVRIPTRLSDFGETEIATLRFAKLRRSTSREPKDSPIATERPASPGPHREAGGYHEDRCAGFGACVSYVSALDVSGSNATDR